MLKITFTLVISLLTPLLFAQTLEFGWMSGSDLLNQPGVYGTKGVSSSDNIPGARHYGISWTDGNNDFWLYGGEGVDRNGNKGALSDLWKYDRITNLWTWISGGDVVGEASVYGVLGVSSPNNNPGGRENAYAWADENGNFWLFGGETEGLHNDLWKYNIQINEWTWVGGSKENYQTPIYGSKGVPSTGNIPGSRTRGASWVDVSGNFWLFGGTAYDKNGIEGLINDLWKYNPSTSEWTWISGGDLVNQSGEYGILGSGDVNNIPGARSRLVSWADEEGNLWLFGGYGQRIATFYINYYNDMWKFNPSNNEWTWITGDTTTYSNALLEGLQSVPPGSYGTQAVPDPTNTPGGREFSFSWVDGLGKFWLFGGWRRNDLWLFDPVNSVWTWMGGNKNFINDETQPGIYGEIQTPSIENVPGTKAGAFGWTDTNSNLWLFGGEEYIPDNPKLHNDLWLIGAKIHQTISFDQIADQIFDSLRLVLDATSSSGLIVDYILSEGSATIMGSELIFGEPGNTSITAIQLGNDKYFAAKDVIRSFCINPSVPIITLTPQVSLSSSSPSSNQWYINDQIISGANSQTLELSSSGDYYVEVTFGDCSNRSEIFNVILAGISDNKNFIQVYPNPVEDHLIFKLENTEPSLELNVYDAMGNRIIKKSYSNNLGSEFQLDVSQLNSGLYTYFISSSRMALKGKFIKP